MLFLFSSFLFFVSLIQVNTSSIRQPSIEQQIYLCYEFPEHAVPLSCGIGLGVRPTMMLRSSIRPNGLLTQRIKEGASVGKIKEIHKRCPFMDVRKSLFYCRSDDVLEYFLGHPSVDILSQNEDGLCVFEVMIMEKMANSSVKFQKILARLQSVDMDQFDLLTFAIKHSNAELFLVLLKNPRVKIGNSLEYACSCRYGHYYVSELLRSPKCTFDIINSRSRMDGFTLLHLAFFSKSPYMFETIQLLLDCGVDWKAKDRFGMSYESLLRKYQQYPLAKFFILQLGQHIRYVRELSRARPILIKNPSLSPSGTSTTTEIFGSDESIF